ncbi:hypothetical protein [Streptacidiphilus melanogenes]|uniref:hypothetical protein n=1 Tax=Streptacidiphilus melanogenes TaxID=411235 RepID=UPI0005A6322C|nr:hypothetical protein [Streptacidiphilus melanogenes]
MSTEQETSADRAQDERPSDMAAGRHAVRDEGMAVTDDTTVDRASSAAAPAPDPAAGRPHVSEVAVGEGPMLDASAVEQLREAWRQVQYDFVDDPHEAIGRADALVERAAVALADAVNARSAAVRRSWHQQQAASAAADPVESTEQLRRVVQEYHAVLDRVLGC